MLTFASYTRIESEKQDVRNPKKRCSIKARKEFPRKKACNHGEHRWESDTPTKAIALKTKNEYKHGNY